MEHVIPQWLIKYTGEPNRKVPLGIDYNTGKVRMYSYNKLKFPACNSCNNNFSELELKAKSIIIKILNEEAIDSDLFNLLFSWFDKIRIGLWLGFIYLNKNMYDIEPNFYISNRIDSNDRMLLIYKTFNKTDGLGFIGVGNPFFDHWPSCFGLFINQFYFINISTDFLFSRRLGLPYPTEKFFTNDGNMEMHLTEGKKYILKPLIRKSFNKSCAEIYQPIIKPEFLSDKNIMKYYYNSYVDNYFNISSSHLGKILINKNNKIIDYKEISNKEWIPKIEHDRYKLTKLVSKEICSFQLFLLKDWPNLDQLNNTEKKFQKKLLSHIKSINNLILRKIDKEL